MSLGTPPVISIRMGREASLPIKVLPEPPQRVSIIGPGMVLTALGVGLGETFMWPRLVILFGPNVRWLFTVGVLVQLFAMLSIARWTLATGESSFFAAARVWKPFMWFFWILALGTYIWPGHISLGANSLEKLTGINWLVWAIGGIILMGVILTVTKVAYNAVESILSTIIGFVVISSAIIAAMVATGQEWLSTLGGLFAFGWMDPKLLTGEWFPVLVGSIAFAGPSGMQQMWYSLYLRDKKAGMSAYGGRITSWLTGEEESMPDTGSTFNASDPKELEKWKGWMKWVQFDAWVLFLGFTTLTTLIFTVLAMAAARLDPASAQLIMSGKQTAALAGMASVYQGAIGKAGSVLFYLAIGLIGWKMTFGIFDAFARGQADMTWYFWPGVKDRWSMSKVYYGFLYAVLVFGIVLLSTVGPTKGPAFILNVMAVASTLSMGAYCALFLYVNNKFLPKEIRPGIITNVMLAVGVVLYWGGFFYNLLKFGKLVV